MLNCERGEISADRVAEFLRKLNTMIIFSVTSYRSIPGELSVVQKEKMLEEFFRAICQEAKRGANLAMCEDAHAIHSSRRRTKVEAEHEGN